MTTRTISVVTAGLIVAGLFCRPLLAREATALLRNDNDGKALAHLQGIYLSHYPSMELVRVYDKHVKFADLSTDGKKIVFHERGALYIMNNDGAAIETIVDPHPDDVKPYWTTNGIMWIHDDTLHRYIVETGAHHRHPVNLRPETHKVCYNADYSLSPLMSRDGRRMWANTGFDPVGIDSLYCGCRGYDRGAHPYMHWSADFSSRDIIWRSEWGHGKGMSTDGYLMLVMLGQHRDLGITRQTATTLEQPYAYYEYETPYPECMEARQIYGCVNNDSLMLSAAKRADQLCSGVQDTDTSHVYFWNWKTNPPELLGEFNHPDSTCEQCVRSATFWDGPLPNPYEDAPYIHLDKSELVFNVSGSTAPLPRIIMATNANTGTHLGKLTTSVEPADASWLRVSVEGNGGDTQTVSCSFAPADLPADEAHATVTLFGGGASNTAGFTVSVYAGAAIAAPTGLSVTATGDSMLDASLSWTDNAQNESGYSIERRSGEQNWAEVARTGSDAASYVDSSLLYGTDYDYRMRAFTIEHDQPERASAYSNVAGLTITGISWIRVTAPPGGGVLKPGNETTITWDANAVSQVYIEVSINAGENWEPVTPEGGIFETADVWGQYPWTVPDTATTEALVKVAAYNQNVSGVSGMFTISPDAAAGGPSGYAVVNPSGVALERAHGTCRLSIGGNDDYDVRLYTISGATVRRRRGGGPAVVPVDTDALSSGVYILRCRIAGTEHIWIIEHGRTDAAVPSRR